MSDLWFEQERWLFDPAVVGSGLFDLFTLGAVHDLSSLARVPPWQGDSGFAA